VDVVDDLEAARVAVLARIPEGSSVMTNTSLTLQETGIAGAIDDGGAYESARTNMMAPDYATQLQEMKAVAGQPDFALGSVHAVTRDGALVVASASGSQLASYVWGAANVIFVVGAQKLVPSMDAARERIYEYSLKLEDARAYAAYGQNSFVGKILQIHQELPGRIHVVLIRRAVGFSSAFATRRWCGYREGGYRRWHRHRDTGSLTATGLQRGPLSPTRTGVRLATRCTRTRKRSGSWQSFWRRPSRSSATPHCG